MGVHIIRLPDIGEGIAEAELTEWLVKPGDVVREDDILAVVMTDKAAVEVPSSVGGKVLELGGEIGELMAVGATLIRIEVDGEGNEGDVPAVDEAPGDEPDPAPEPKVEPTSEPAKAPERAAPAVARAKGTKPLASPSVRARAREEGINLRQVPGSGPASRISHSDLDQWIASGGISRVRSPVVPIPASKKCASSACAARLPKRCSIRNARSRISPSSKRLKSKRSTPCAWR